MEPTTAKDEAPASSSSPSSNNLEFRANVKLIVYKVFYFSYWGAVGCFLPYLSLYFKQLGFSPTVVGLVSALRPLTGFLLLPFIATAADRCRCRKAVLVASVFLGIGLLLALAFLPTASKVPCDVMEEQIEEFLGLNVSLIHHDEKGQPTRPQPSPTAPAPGALSSILHAAPKLPGPLPTTSVNVTTDIQFPEAVQKKLIANQSWMYDQMDLGKIILAVLALATLVEVAMFSAICQADIGTLDALRREHGNVDQYGWNRGFGTLGWGACSFAVGLLLSSTRTLQLACGFEHVVTGYWLVFAVAAGISGVAFVSIFYFGPYTYVDKEEDEKASSWAVLWSVLFSWHYGSVVLVLTFLAVCNGSMWGFLYWHLDNMGATQSLLGSVTAIQCLSDFFFGYVSAWTIGKYGHIPLLAGGVLIYVIRFFYYSWIPLPWLVVFSEVFHGLASILTWITAVAYMNEAVPPMCRSTIQGVLVALYNGLGAGLGFFLSGLSVSSFGAPATFGLYAVVSSVVLVIFLIIQGLSSIPPAPWKEADTEKTLTPGDTDAKEDDSLLRLMGPSRD